MRAIVLSGGGSKGSYEIGFWKAIRKLNIKYDIVTGTSVGALNGALMVQRSYLKGLILWYNLNYDDIFEYDKNKYSEDKINELYKDNILKGGVEVSNLQKTITKYIRPKKIFNSKINFGLITVKVPSLKHVEMTKKELNENNIVDYLIASASCFPAFKLKKIDNDFYIDGGFYDNLPINLAVSLGATEVIAVDLDAIGIKRRIKYDVPITYITPNNDICPLLEFEKNSARRGIRLGYNDTMKHYKKLDGDKYTFKLNDLKNNFDKYYLKINKNIDLSISEDNKLYNRLLENITLKEIFKNKQSFNKELNKTIEKMGYIFSIDDSYIYSIKKFNKRLIEEFNKIKLDKDDIEMKIKNNKTRLLFHQKMTIKYLYELIKEQDKKIDKLVLIFPLEFLMAIYLKTIIEG